MKEICKLTILISIIVIIIIGTIFVILFPINSNKLVTRLSDFGTELEDPDLYTIENQVAYDRQCTPIDTCIPIPLECKTNLCINEKNANNYTQVDCRDVADITTPDDCMCGFTGRNAPYPDPEYGSNQIGTCILKNK